MKALRKEIESDLGLEKGALKEQKTVITAYVDKLLTASKAEAAAKEAAAKKKKASSTAKAKAPTPTPTTKGSTGTKRKSKKDPNAPKKNMTAFLFFSNDKRAEVTAELKAANPDLKGVAEVGKRLGELWKELSDADKEPYNKQAEADKARYLKEMESYTPSETAAEEPTKAAKAARATKATKTTPAGAAPKKYSERVEKLKKKCSEASIRVPISVYTQYKKHGNMKQLEGDILALLEKEGLSAKSTKDEILEVRERLELARDTEGIDASNIIKSPEGGRRGRRRAAAAAVMHWSQQSQEQEDPEIFGDTPETSESSATDDDFDDYEGGDGASPTLRKKTKKSRVVVDEEDEEDDEEEDDEEEEDDDDDDEGEPVKDEVKDMEAVAAVVAADGPIMDDIQDSDDKLQSIETRAKPVDEASQYVPKKMADWSDDDDDE